MTRMGDIIQSIPFFRRLRAKHPEARIELLVESSFADVAAFLPGIDNIISVRLEDILLCFDRNSGKPLEGGLKYYSDLVKDLQRQNYDEVWNLTHTRPFTVLNTLVGGSRARGVTLDDSGLQRVTDNWLKYFYATNLARPWCQFNLVDIYANCIRGIPRHYGRNIHIESKHYQNSFPRNYRARTEKPRVALHPGASQMVKQWPINSYQDLTRMLLEAEYEVLLIGGRSDRGLGEHLQLGDAVINLIGETSVTELAAVLADCDLLVSNDSGPMHVAAAVETPVIAVTLGSALGSETAPYGAGHLVVEPKIDCFPCAAEKHCSSRHCAALVRPGLIFDLLRSRLTGTDPEINEYDYSHTRIYETVQEQHDGQLRLRRLPDTATDERDVYQNLLRKLWPVWLDDAAPPPPHELAVPAELRARAGAIIQRAREASKLCTQLAAENFSSQKFERNSDKLISEWLAVDAELTHELSELDATKSILTYLSIEKGSIGGHELSEQALNTAKAYDALAAMLNPLCDDSATNKRINSIERDKVEECYENHT
jgi:ADP-heptose:LPS heptosyltransferase